MARLVHDLAYVLYSRGVEQFHIVGGLSTLYPTLDAKALRWNGRSAFGGGEE